MKSYKELKAELLKDPEIRREYEKPDYAWDIGHMVHEARIIKGVTQKELAEKVGTKQASISRLENGNSMPSMSFLLRIAEALETKLIPPQLACVKDPITYKKYYD